MFHHAYELLIRFASSGTMALALQEAKAEFIAQTGELFESDPSFERRLSLFLEWYVLDRGMPEQGGKRPVELCLEHSLRERTDPKVIAGLTALIHQQASLFEFRRQRGERLYVLDLLTGEKKEVLERRHALGLCANDIFEARLVPTESGLLFTENSAYFPSDVRKHLLRAARTFQKQNDTSREGRVRLLHKLAFCRNRSDRYRHVAAGQIFSAQGFLP